MIKILEVLIAFLELAKQLLELFSQTHSFFDAENIPNPHLTYT